MWKRNKATTLGIRLFRYLDIGIAMMMITRSGNLEKKLLIVGDIRREKKRSQQTLPSLFCPGIISLDCDFYPAAMKDRHKELCLNILDFMLANHKEKYEYFQGPAEQVLPETEKEIYRQLIKNPRDLTLIRENLAKGKYMSIAAFETDVKLVFDNAKTFCKNRYPEVGSFAH